MTKNQFWKGSIFFVFFSFDLTHYVALVFKGITQRSFGNSGKEVLTLVESYQNCHQLESVIATTSATCLSNPSPINVLSLCDSSVNQWCFGDLTNVSLAVEDANSKIVDVKNVFVQ